MDSYGFLWIPMNSYGFLWIPMNSPKGFVSLQGQLYVPIRPGVYTYMYMDLCPNPVFIRRLSKGNLPNTGDHQKNLVIS
jgi:hypothetical protein